MELRALGSTGIHVSVLGLGTVKIGRNQQVKYPQAFDLPDDATVRDLFSMARELGINFIDTAPAYGSSEQRLGELLPARNDWVVMTKVGEIFEHGESRFDFTAAYTRASVERSLTRLKRDVLDIVLVHSDGDDMRIIHQEGALEALDKLKQNGLIKAFGMSTKTVAGGLWIVEHCDVVMATCNLSYNEEADVLALAKKLNKGVVVKKGLQSGHADTASGGGGVEQSIAHVLSQDGVSSMIVGTINKKHLADNIEITNRVLAMTSSESQRI
jgi:aryl-alcohol dehydrogenase-like predicted oxidoreductase